VTSVTVPLAVETPIVPEMVEDLRFDNVRFGDRYVDGELDWLS
jgi:hypothetical protein